MNRKILYFFTILSLVLIGSFPLKLRAEELQDKQLRKDMWNAFESFEKLQKYLINEDRFSDQKNSGVIGDLLKNLSESFNKAEEAKARLSDRPGFASTLKVVAEKIGDAEKRFEEGRKGYALWRLKTIGNYCVSCHTTYSVSLQISHDSSDLKDLDNPEKAEFFLASRQFDKAAPLFLKSIQEQKNPRLRMNSLRKWLMIYIRVYKDPEVALRELQSLLTRVSFSRHELDEISGYRESLLRWKKEGKITVDPLRRAENLIRQAVAINDPLSSDKGIVELLRATAILHSVLESSELDYKDQRGHILYLLGLSYSRLPLFFVNELPEVFLEMCIREVPNTKDARSCFKLYSNNVYLGFTGSGGTDIPDDVEASLAELYELAYGTKRH